MRIINVKENPMGLTHAGVFHADEVFASVILHFLFGNTFTLARVNVVPEGYAGIVFDIGRGELDHHQPEKVYHENGIPRAACGLVWAKYGVAALELSLGLTHEESVLVHQKMDKGLILAIDAHDNGIVPDDPYRPYDVSQLIHQFNPTWLDDESADEAFMAAFELAKGVFEREVKNYLAAIRAENEVKSSPRLAADRVLVLDRYLPWKGAIGKDDPAMYVISPSMRGGYQIQAVPVSPCSMELRKPFPAEWRGKSSDLADVTGIPGSNFCHTAGFIASAETKDAAIALAIAAVETK
jgi:uncharacterized UPF0160 family protein